MGGHHGNAGFLSFCWSRRDAANQSRSELFRDSDLFQHRVGGMPGQDRMVNRKTALRYRAVPDFVVSFADRSK
jgi:hypothetical protein